MTRPPRVSVIVPVRDDPEGLRHCLEALERQRYPSELVEVVVVDNGSRNDPAPALARRSVVLLREPRPGSYAARNTGVRNAGGDVLASTDADCRPRPDWLTAGVAALQEHSADAAGGRVVVTTRDDRRRTAAELFECVHAFEQRVYVEERAFSATANLFVTRGAVEAVGPFDATLQSGGDREWGQRLVAAGRRLVYAEAAVIDHPARRRLGSLLRKRRRVVQGHLELARRGRLQANAPFAQPLHVIVRSSAFNTWQGVRSPVLRSPGDRFRYLLAAGAVLVTTVVTVGRQRLRPR